MADEQISFDHQPEAVEYEREFIDVFASAERDAALEWADSLSETPPAEDSGLVDQAGDAALGVGRDVGLGVLSAPRSAIRGATKGANEILSFVDAADDFLPTVSFLDEAGERQLLPDFVFNKEAEARIEKAFKKRFPDNDQELGRFPVIDKPKVDTVTGNIIETIAQFAVGFKGVDKAGKLIKGIDKLDEAGRAAKLAGNIGKGALADVLAFDEQEQRLSSVIEGTAWQNPVTEFLATDPEDGAAEAKLKQFIEGATLGGIGDIVFDGLSLIRKGRVAKDVVEGAGKNPEDLFNIPAEEAAGLAVDEKTFRFLGDASDDNLVLRTKRKIAVAADEAADVSPDDIGRTVDDTERAIEINFARIEGPEDIKSVMDQMANDPDLLESIDVSRRGVRDARTTLTAATDIDGFDELMGRRTGDTFNAEQVVAARKVYYDTTEKLMAAAKAAAAPEASDIDQFNFRKMVALHHAVQKEFMGVRAEAGRALQAWNIPVSGGGAENARALEQVLNEFGGAEASKDLAKRIVQRGNNLNTSQLNAMTQKAALARTTDAVTEAWTLGLLTNPTTHVVNVSSNVLTGLTLGLERLASAFVKDSPVTLREGMQYFVGMMEAQKLGMKNAAEAFRTGQTGIGISKLDLPRTRLTARDILDPEGKAGVISKGLDWYGAVLNKYAGGALAAGDEYSKTILYHAQLHALAVREAVAQGMDEVATQQHIARVLAEPPSHLRADAVDFANYGTFTKELGEVGQSVQRGIARYPLARFVMPFVRTPANIFKFTFERTPLAPLSQKVRDDIAAGGVRKAMAVSKIGLGTSIMAIGNDMAMNGIITGAGPSDGKTRAALRRTGWQPYSIKIGETWYSYARFEPVATVLGMSADLSEMLSNYEAYDIDAQKEADELVTAMVIAAGNQVVGKTFLSGFADLVEVLSDPGRYGEGFVNRFAGSFVPAGSAAIERAINPEMEQVFNMSDAFKSRIPGASNSVIKRRNIWGEEIKYFYPNEKDLAGATAERLLSLFNPVYYSSEKGAPVDAWMLRNGFEINMPDKQQRFDGVKIDLRDHPQIYDRLVALRGNELELSRYGNQSMKSFFENLANEDDPFGRHIGFFLALGNDFDDQQNFIRQVVRDYTEAAREQVREEFPEIDDIVGRERVHQALINGVRPSLREEQEVQ